MNEQPLRGTSESSSSVKNWVRGRRWLAMCTLSLGLSLALISLLAAAPGVKRALAAPAWAPVGPFTPITGVGNPLNGVDVGENNHPTFVDIDGDGDMDALFGNDPGEILFHRNIGTATNPTFTWVYTTANPFYGVDVGGFSAPTFADLDADGDMDAFIGEWEGNIIFYRNIGTATSPTFTLVTGAGNPFDGVDVGYFSAPTFVDIDGDGDMDAFIGKYTSEILDFYRNTGTAISPTFTLVTGAGNPFDNEYTSGLNNPTFVDVDEDGDMDAFIGESFGNLNFFRNTGTAITPTFTRVTGAEDPFEGVDVGDYSAPAFVDVDGDGDKDAFIGEINGVVYFFRNRSVALTPGPFTLVETVGDDAEYSTPAFVDIDFDGDMDFFIGEYSGNLNFFRNFGTVIYPSFGPVSDAENPFGSADVGDYSAPAFVDVDRDGDMDAFVGEGDGNLNFFRNTGTAITPTFSLITGADDPFDGVNVGSNSTPTFVDIDGDGDMDAFIGKADGYIDFYRNTGTANSPIFTPVSGAGNPLDHVDVGTYSAPTFVDIDGDGDMDAFIGNRDGILAFYRNAGNAITPTLTLVTGAGNPFDGVDVGDSSTPAFFDLWGDGDMDPLVGKANGDLNFYVNNGPRQFYLPLVLR